MCLAIFAERADNIPMDRVRGGMTNNPDGAGLCYPHGKKIKIVKGLWTENEVIQAIEKIGSTPMSLHFRYATHGAIDSKNCHPFRISRDCAVIHNGVIPGFGSHRVSDTAEFTHFVLKPSYQEKTLRTKNDLKWLEENIGYSKLVIMHRYGEVDIVNEQLGHWENGIWYSNTSYQVVPSIFQSRPSAGTCSKIDWDEIWGEILEKEVVSDYEDDSLWVETSPGKYRYVPIHSRIEE